MMESLYPSVPVELQRGKEYESGVVVSKIVKSATNSKRFYKTANSICNRVMSNGHNGLQCYVVCENPRLSVYIDVIGNGYSCFIHTAISPQDLLAQA